jgi:cytosine/uracil/thiamine/allantoin permease
MREEVGRSIGLSARKVQVCILLAYLETQLLTILQTRSGFRYLVQFPR